MTDDSFADAPPSISELRSQKSERASDWTPRDALVALLREIDRGDTKVDFLTICIANRDDEGRCFVDYRSAGAHHLLETLGLVQRVMHRLNRGADVD